MNKQLDPATILKSIIDSIIYMVLGTSDETGTPWVSPVYFASRDYTNFYWVSSPHARHSLNISVRPQISVVIFDSHLPIGTGQGVYMEAIAGELTGADLETGIGVYSQASVKDGASEWSLEVVRSPAPYRLYMASATGHWVLDRDGQPDHRIQISL